MSKIRVAIAEDHELVRKGIINLLSDEEDIEIVFDASNGKELIDQLETTPVDIVILDLEMPVMSGREALPIVNERISNVRVIILSMYYTDDFVVERIGCGARGYLPKNCDIEQLINAIQAVHDQGYYFDDKVSTSLFMQLLQRKDFNPTFTNESLSPREIDIVKLICEGKTNKEIANDLYLSVRTVEVHRKNIGKKTNSTNTAGIVIYAIKNGLYKV